MEERINFAKVSPGAVHHLLGLEKYLHDCGLELPLLDLIKLRVSQINGCAYCLDMHWKDLRAEGENEQRLYSLDARERVMGHRLSSTQAGGHKMASVPKMAIVTGGLQGIGAGGACLPLFLE